MNALQAVLSFEGGISSLDHVQVGLMVLKRCMSRVISIIVVFVKLVAIMFTHVQPLDLGSK